MKVTLYLTEEAADKLKALSIGCSMSKTVNNLLLNKKQDTNSLSELIQRIQELTAQLNERQQVVEELRQSSKAISGALAYTRIAVFALLHEDFAAIELLRKNNNEVYQKFKEVLNLS